MSSAAGGRGGIQSACCPVRDGGSCGDWWRGERGSSSAVAYDADAEGEDGIEDVYESHERWRSVPLAILVCDPVRASEKSGGGGGARRRLVDRESVLLGGWLFPPPGCTGWGAGAGGGAGRSVARTTSKKEDVRGEPSRLCCAWGGGRSAGTVADAGLCPRAGTPNSSTSGGLFWPLRAGLDVSARGGGPAASRRFMDGIVFACPLLVGGRSWARGRGGGSSGCHDVVNRSFRDELDVRGVGAASGAGGRMPRWRGGRSRKSDIAGRVVGSGEK